MTIPEQAVHAAHAEYHKVLGDSNRSNPMLAALTAALPFLTAVKLKALEWVKPPLSETLSRCETEFGTYRTWTHDEANGKWFWSVEGGYNEVTGEATDEEAAKAAAQADYEARIRSAIETVIPVSAPSPRAQALEEAAKIAFDVSENGEYHGEASVDSTSSIYQQGAFEVYEAIRALSSQPVADVRKGDWREIEISQPLKGRRISPAYFPVTGEVCEVSGPNCDDDKGYTWGETTILWQNEMFVLYGKDGYWPVLHKHEYVLFRPLPASPGASE